MQLNIAPSWTQKQNSTKWIQFTVEWSTVDVEKGDSGSNQYIYNTCWSLPKVLSVWVRLQKTSVPVPWNQCQCFWPWHLDGWSGWIATCAPDTCSTSSILFSYPKYTIIDDFTTERCNYTISYANRFNFRSLNSPLSATRLFEEGHCSSQGK